MKYIRTIFGKFDYSDVVFLSKIGINIKEGYGMFSIEEGEQYQHVVEELRRVPKFQDRRTKVIFDSSVLSQSSTFMCHNSSPQIGKPAILSKSDDSYEYLRYAFGDICTSCNNIPKGEQIRPFTFEAEPKLSKKKLWGSIQGVSGYLFTDNARYRTIKKILNVKKIDVLIGRRQKVSNDFVQIDIPIAQKPLSFGSSNFGNTFKLNGSGKISESLNICNECHRPLYTNQVLDFFPPFVSELEFDAVFTKEWFGWYRRLVISGDLAKWMVENKYIHFSSDYLIPVR